MQEFYAKFVDATGKTKMLTCQAYSADQAQELLNKYSTMMSDLMARKEAIERFRDEHHIAVAPMAEDVTEGAAAGEDGPPAAEGQGPAPEQNISG